MLYIEVAHTLNSDSCIMAIRNFIARRGTPQEFYTDNGTNFVGARKELDAAVAEVDQNVLYRNFTTTKTKWVFNPPAAPHMGGAWERLVRSIKTNLEFYPTMRSPNDELLRSILCEVENIIKSRPLTYIPIESENLEALTPNHFLLGSSGGIKPLKGINDSPVLLKRN